MWVDDEMTRVPLILRWPGHLTEEDRPAVETLLGSPIAGGDVEG